MQNLQYPLQWPEGWPRSENKERSRFETPLSQAVYGLVNEIKLLGGRNPVISCNIPIRKTDGMPYSKYSEPDDSGVAVYFELDGKQQCIPCDKWDRVRDNAHAIELTIAALRGLERWGAKEMVKAAFRGFEALPAPGELIVPKVDYFGNVESMQELREKFRDMAKNLHPDTGGDSEQYQEMLSQYGQKKKELKEYA